MKRENLLKVLFLSTVALAIARCGGSGNNNNAVGPYFMNANGQCMAANGTVAPSPTYCTNGTGYSYVNGQCVSTTTGQIAASPTYCTSSTGYSYVNGQCVSTTTGQIAPSPTYCTSTTGITGYSYVNGQCISTTTGQIAPSPTYCTSATTGFTPVTGVGTPGYGVGMGYGTPCYGLYMWNGQVATTVADIHWSPWPPANKRIANKKS